jgi:hypothetical protein
MSAGQKLLPRRSLTEQFVPLVSARVPLFRPATGCLRGRDRRSRIVAANPPDHTFTIASNCKRDGQKNPDANARFLPYLTIFRMNTCTKKVGGWGCRFSTLTLTPRSGMQGLANGLACNCTPRAIALQCGSRFR